MAEYDRPVECPYPKTCLCLTGYDNKLCVGRMPKPRKHDELKNTHRFCLGDDQTCEINDADAYYIMRCMQAIRQDVVKNNLYTPKEDGVQYDFRKDKIKV